VRRIGAALWRPRGDRHRLDSRPSPRSYRLTRRSSSGRSLWSRLIRSLSCCCRVSSTGCATGDTPTPTRFTGCSSAESPPSRATTTSSTPSATSANSPGRGSQAAVAHRSSDLVTAPERRCGDRWRGPFGSAEPASSTRGARKHGLRRRSASLTCSWRSGSELSAAWRNSSAAPPRTPHETRCHPSTRLLGDKRRASHRHRP
jgi:hypothetical protein